MSEANIELIAGNIVVSAAILAGAIVLVVLVGKGYRRLIKSDMGTKERETVLRVTLSILRFILVIGAVLVVLQINGFEVGSILAGLGIASAVVGLALQDVLKDGIMGIHIMIDRFFRVGDCVEYAGDEGIIVGFSIMTTKIESLKDGAVTTICNRNISEIRKLGNQTDINIPLSHDQDTALVRSVLKNSCRKIANVENVERCSFEGTQDIGDAAPIYKVRLICAPEKKYPARRKALAILQDELEQAGIAIPYGLDVHMNPAIPKNSEDPERAQVPGLR